MMELRPPQIMRVELSGDNQRNAHSFKTAIKPTASIGLSQRSFSISENVEKDLEIKGRHDPCIGIRILPVIESVCALTILDFMEY